MGINLSMLPFFDWCHERGALRAPVVALGSQELHESETEIRTFASAHGYSTLSRELTVRGLFRDRYSVTDYVDVDINEHAQVKLDLNAPLPAVLHGSAATVMNVGTAEHVFDIARVFRSIHELARVGATIIHFAPISWYEHGFVNFNPVLFRAVARANRYRLLAEAFYYTDAAASGPGDACPRVRMTFDGTRFTSEQRAIADAFFDSPLPVRTLYMVAYEKPLAAEFVVPYDDESNEMLTISSIQAARATLLDGPFRHQGGHAWSVAIPDLEHLADHRTGPTHSTMVVLEDGRPLGARHAIHDDIRQVGFGRYSHWTDYLIFSTSDNSDPNVNGREYRFLFEES
ncbi:MAG: hypothetical protein NDJ92_01260 [Thermoanaerobaculia bacterium]|nr:hypothetical protein [Thermoanaerobaculia bacterium]